MLTVKQEAFCQYIMQGLTQSEAYRRAYDCENMADNSISSNAYKLINDTDIALRIKQLRDQLAEMMLFPRIERLKVLHQIAATDDTAMHRDKINAIKTYNEMTGDNAPSKTEITGANGGPVTTQSLSSIPDDELKTMLEKVQSAKLAT